MFAPGEKKLGHHGTEPVDTAAGIVTSTSRSIGRAIALGLTRRGASAAFNYQKRAEMAGAQVAVEMVKGVKFCAQLHQLHRHHLQRHA